MSFSRFLDPKNDFLFRRLFGEERHKDLLISFINNILHLKGPDAVQDVTYLKTIQDPEVASKKQSIVDVLCRDEKGVQFIIEMQVAKTPGFEKRAQYYASKAYINQMNAGDPYENLKEVIFIAMSDYVMFPEKEYWKSSHATLDCKTYARDLEAFSFTFIELPKFKKDLHELQTVEEKWVYFFKHAYTSSDAELEQFIGNDVILKKALEVTTKYSMTEEEWNTYEQDLKNEMDRQNIERGKLQDAEEEGLRKGFKRGIEKGIEKGIEQGIEKGADNKSREIALVMLDAKEPLDKISLFTGLSKEVLETVKADRG